MDADTVGYPCVPVVAGRQGAYVQSCILGDRRKRERCCGQRIAGQGFEGLAISVDDAERAGRLPGPHRDPFDRMLIAQAQVRDLAIVSVDSAFDTYAVHRLW